MRYINFNGNIQSENIPVIHSWNRAFRFGDGLFESIAASGNSLPFFDDHWLRLVKGAHMLSLDFSPQFTKDFLKKSILELLSLNGLQENAYARVALFREGKGRYQPQDMQAGYVIETESVSGELFAFNSKGLSLGLFGELQKPLDKLANFKTCSALVYVLASVYKTKNRLDDCAILNTKTNICDSTNSNIFLVHGNALTTPSLEEGCIDGVMRRQVLTFAKANKMRVSEQAVDTEALRGADEVFLTNAVSGIRWVESYGTKKFSHSTAFLLSEKLRKQIAK